MIRGPLFGSSSAFGLRVFGSQLLDDGTSISAVLSSGFPGSRSGVVRVENHPLGDGRIDAEVGDVEISLGQPSALGFLTEETYLVTGATAVYRAENDWTLQLGQARSSLRPVSAGDDEPAVMLFSRATEIGKGRSEVGLLQVFQPFYAIDEERSWDGVAFGSYIRSVGRRTNAFAQVLSSIAGAPGVRAGVTHTASRHQTGIAIYHFDEHLPDLYPLLKPGETGISFSGSLRLAQGTNLSTSGAYSLRERTSFGRGSSLYGTATLAQSFGSDRPFLFATYSKSDVIRDELSGRVRLVVADRFSVGVRQSLGVQLYNIEGEYIANQVNAPDRAQLLVAYHRVIGPRTVLETSAVVQRQENDIGATTEVAFERSARRGYFLIGGLRGTYIEREGVETGEAAVRVGVSRRLFGQGWYGRIEVRVPFSVGLPRSNVNQNAIAAELGRRVSWRGTEGFRAAILPLLAPEMFGAIAGSVMIGSEPVKGLTILLNGQPVATTDARGQFRLNRVGVGDVVVSIDATELEPGLSSEEGFSRRVVVAPRTVTQVEFAIERYKTLQAVILVCTGGAPRPAADVKLALIRADFARTYVTDSLGALRDDTLPPGIYDLIIDPSSLPGVPPDQIPQLQIDLTDDVLGRVIRIGCDPTATPAPPPAPPTVRTYAGKIVACDGETPVAGASVFLMSAGSVYRTVTAQDGAFRFGGVAPDTYVLLVEGARVIADLTGAGVTDAVIRVGCR